MVNGEAKLFHCRESGCESGAGCVLASSSDLLVQLLILKCTLQSRMVHFRNKMTAGFSGAMMDPVAALILCTPGIGNVDISVINGKIVVKDGKLTTIDLKVRQLS